MNKVIHGDCLEIMPSIASSSIDSIITDPPYGINLQPQRKKTKAIDGDKNEDARLLWHAFVPECYRVAKEDTSHIFWSRWSEVWVKDLLAEYFTVKSCIVWVKNNFGIGYYTRPQHEFAWYCHKGKPPKPQKAISDVWNFKRLNKLIHSCQKPIPLMEKCVEFCSEDGDVVLDIFGGVGSTALACLNTNRNYILIEKEKEYIDITNKRIAEHEQQLALC